MENIDNLKISDFFIRNKPIYLLKNAKVYISKSGFHFTDYLDPDKDIEYDINNEHEDIFVNKYIESQLQSNGDKFLKQAKKVEKYIGSFENKNILDIGCGGGLFLSIAKSKGANVHGIEPSNPRAFYANKKNKIKVFKLPIENSFWKGKRNNYDLVTLWDVIEHVNFPFKTIECSCKTLVNGGFLILDTPCRDSFFHKLGELTYKYSKGKFPTFLNVMYSSHLYGHKQIFSKKEICNILTCSGMEILEIKQFHELSFPIDFYINKLIRNKFILKLMVLMIPIFLKFLPVKNKMIIVGRKK